MDEFFGKYVGKYVGDSVEPFTPSDICEVTHDGQQPGEVGNIAWTRAPRC